MNRIFKELVDDISQNDITFLSSKYREDILFDFKECISFEKLRVLGKDKKVIDSCKHDFAVDVASFANTEGGYLVFGIKEEDRFPSEFTPFEIDSFEKLEMTLGRIIRERIEPQIHGCQYKEVKLTDNKYVFIVSIPRSTNAPHGVLRPGEENFYFYGRKNEGENYQYKFSEIKNYFIQRNNMHEKIKTYRKQRIDSIMARESSLLLAPNPKIIMHLFPQSAFDNKDIFDVEFFHNNYQDLLPINNNLSGYGNIRNFDGILVYELKNNQKPLFGYVQLYRNGIIESVDASILKLQTGFDNELISIIPGQFYEPQLISALRRYMSALYKSGVNPPVYCAITLLDVKGYSMAYDVKSIVDYSQRSNPIDRDFLILPEFEISDLSDLNIAADLLKSSFDLIWNACGLKESRNYNKGKYNLVE